MQAEKNGGFLCSVCWVEGGRVFWKEVWVVYVPDSKIFAFPSSHMAHYMGVTARGKHVSVGG